MDWTWVEGGGGGGGVGKGGGGRGEGEGYTSEHHTRRQHKLCVMFHYRDYGNCFAKYTDDSICYPLYK